MPTKLNSAGKQQNYVPAGNGDASGEYGDNATGSNKHFQSFKKPSRTSELSKKQIKEIGNYIGSRNYLEDDRIISSLRYYTGNFGDLSKYTDDELKEMIKEIKDLKTSDTPVYFKDGKKWKLTYDTGLLEKAGIPYYTEEQREKIIRDENISLLEKSQTQIDKDIQKEISDKCVVCFGKGYSDSDLKQIQDDTKTFINDFPELKDTITAIGDRNNLEKYINAIKSQQEPSEEQIQKEINRIKKYSFSYVDETEESFRKRAISNLTKPIKLDSLRNAYAYWDGDGKRLIFMGKMKKLTDEQKDREYLSNFKSSDKRNATYCHEMGHATYTALNDYFKKKYEELENSIPQYGDDNYENALEIRNQIYPRLRQMDNLYEDFKFKLGSLKYKNVNSDYNKQFEAAFKEHFDVLPDDMNIDYSTRELYKKQVEKELFHKGIRRYNLSRYGAENLHEFIAESFSAYYTGMNNPLANKVVELFKDYSKKLREV